MNIAADLWRAPCTRCLRVFFVDDMCRCVVCIRPYCKTCIVLSPEYAEDPHYHGVCKMCLAGKSKA